MKTLVYFLPLLLSALFLAVNQFARPPAKLKPKVFVIGLSKTGTTSTGNALALLGYKRIGWKDIRSRHLVHTFIHGNKQPLLEQTQYFDAFEDLPWPFMYEEMAERFPDARFLLTLRKDEKTWLASMERHQSRGVWQPAVHFYGTQDIGNKAEIAARAYRNHSESVREFFRDKPHRYAELVIDNDSETNWRALCRVAECAGDGVPSIPFPKSNTIAHWKQDSIVGKFHTFWGWSISRVEEMLVDMYYGHDWPPVKFALEHTWRLASKIELACSDLYFRLAVQRQPAVPMK